MKPENISDAIGMLDEDLIAGADAARKGRLSDRSKRRRPFWVAGTAAAVCLCLLVTCLFVPGTSSKATVIAEAVYPQMSPYPNEEEYISPVTGEFDDEGFSQVYDAWRESRQAQLNQPDGYQDGLEAFFSAATANLLSGAEGENLVYSPLNLYMTLAMLAELTEGQSRDQILELMGVENIDALRNKAASLWNANYCDDGSVTSILANSLWLNEDVSFQQSTLDRLASVYYASSYRGQMGSASFDRQLQDWLSQQTGGLLEEQAQDISMTPDTVMALASTVYFRAKWSAEFSESSTTEEVFHTPAGDISCDFMHQSSTRNYYWSEQFSAVSLSLRESGSMWLFLPDEGVNVQALLTDENVTRLLFDLDSWTDSRFLIVNLAMPKFDVSSDLRLKGSLQAMGITDVFDPSVSDFSPMTRDAEGIYLSQADHAARVAVDEEGVTAAAYTVMATAGAGEPPDEEVDFVLDRPFLFVITGCDGSPLFAGIVSQPVQ